ncbi:MAG: helix-turn-helix transcriptional regulator [Actinobacteria bacterium]|nr:helix-turn-helix transcriptional regulator [Actinomycetota bacterium]
MDNKSKIDAVVRMQDYIEKNINEKITLYSLAGQAGYSPWHSARIFKEVTGKAPFDYIRSLRLSHAAFRLQNKKERIIDVAFDFVFDSHEGFTRAFSRQFGMTPKYYSNNNRTPLKLFMPQKTCGQFYNKLKERKDAKMDNKTSPKTIFVQVIDRPARKTILKRGISATHYFEYCQEVDCSIWDVLTDIKEAIYEPVGMWLPDNMIKPGTSVYAQGVEVPINFEGKVPEGLEIIELPPCKMMIFQGQPYDDENFEDEIFSLQEAIKNYDPTIYGFKWACQDGPRIQLEPLGYRGYIEGRPVRQVN